MKAVFQEDLTTCEPASVRAVLTAFAAIDWFVPPAHDDAEAPAVYLLRCHNQLGYARNAALFSPELRVRAQYGTWSDFLALWEVVRRESRGWDWKYSALKVLSRQHARENNWSFQDQRDSMFFLRLGETVVWKFQTGSLGEALKSLPMNEACLRAAAQYHGYAGMDAMEAVQWQLAQPACPLDENPFVPLLQCYATGFYPFSLSRDEMIAFAFAPT